jgi:3-mercaptopyruvate sulfurtransferase SseA
MALRLLRQLLTLAVLGGVVGFALNPFTPKPVPPGTPVHPASASAAATCGEKPAAAPHEHRMMAIDEALKACVGCTAAFVDARGDVAFAEGHIPGAVHLPPEGQEEAAAAIAKLRGYATVVVYDADAGCRLAAGVADRLLAQGFSDVRLLEGSWTAWDAARGPAQAGACEECGRTSQGAGR